jgi:hypothetical protein
LGIHFKNQKNKPMKKNTGILASTMVTGALVMQGALSHAQNAPSANVSSNEAIWRKAEIGVGLSRM